MSSDLSTVSSVDVTNTDGVNGVTDKISTESLTSLLYALVKDKLSQVESDAKDDLAVSQSRARRMKFLNDLTRALNAASDDSGGFLGIGATTGSVDTSKHPELQALRQQIVEMKDKVEQLIKDAEAIEAEVEELRKLIQGKDDIQMKALVEKREAEARAKRDEAAEYKDIMIAAEPLMGPANDPLAHKTLTRDQKLILVENLRGTYDNFSTINNQHQMMMNRRNNERHEVIMFARQLLKEDDTAMRGPLRHIARYKLIVIT